MSSQLIGLGTKSQGFLISFSLDEMEPRPDFHRRALTIKSELVLIRDKTGKIKKVTGK